MRCVVRDEEGHRSQAAGGSDRWKSGQSKWTEYTLQVQFRDKLSILLSCPQPNRPAIQPWPTASLSLLCCLIFHLSHGSCYCSIVVSNHIRRCWAPSTSSSSVFVCSSQVKKQSGYSTATLQHHPSQENVPVLWKRSFLVSVPKRSHLSSSNDYGHVA